MREEGVDVTDDLDEVGLLVVHPDEALPDRVHVLGAAVGLVALREAAEGGAALEIGRAHV